MRKVKINQGRAVPLTFRIVGIGIVIVIIIKMMQHTPASIAIPLAVLLSFLVPMLWFSSTILTINPETKEIHLETWILGFKTGKARNYGRIEKIFVNKVNVSQTMNTRANSYTSSQVEYHAFVKLDDGEKYFLVSDRSEKKLEQRVTKIREMLGLI